MKTQTDPKKWWNTLGQTKQNEYALEYYGVDSSYILDDEIEAIYYDTQRYHIEFDGNKLFKCLFPAAQKEFNNSFKTLEEALNYMLVEKNIKEVTIKN